VTVLGEVNVPGGIGPKVVAVRQGNRFATAFHPEVTGDLRVHRYFVDLVAAS
jgi:pyridoxal 5'-phosphate synthase pdxT subunit